MHKIVDVSNNNGPAVNFRAIKAAGASAVWLKVTQGVGFVDPDYRANRARAKAAGLQVGGYHFGEAANHPGAEAAFFLAHLELEPGDLLPALDLEAGGIGDAPADAVRAYAAGFLAALAGKIGAEPVLYAGSYVIRDNRLERLRSPRWIPSYGARPELYSWAAWQLSDGEPRYPGTLLHLDTSVSPALELITYKAPRHRRVIGHAKRARYVIRDGLYLRVPSRGYRWWQRNRKRLEGRLAR